MDEKTKEDMVQFICRELWRYPKDLAVKLRDNSLGQYKRLIRQSKRDIESLYNTALKAEKARIEKENTWDKSFDNVTRGK